MRLKRIIGMLCVLLSLAAQAQNDTVLFSAHGGFYDDVFALELFNNYPQNHIRFTTNGNRPTAQSSLYEDSIWMNASNYSRSNIYTIQISPDDLVYVPDSVQHCIVSRAAVFDENDSCVSRVVTNSYFIHALGCDTHGLAAVSLCADSLDLFGFERGIMVPGILFDSLDPKHTGNYYMHGREWEREANVEYYECANNNGINQVCGLRTHGNLSRRHPSKGMKVYARNEYGKKRFYHGFFDDTVVNSYKHLVLKPFALAYPYSGTQDYLCNKMALQLGLPSSNSRPVIVYLNGEYWGVYFLQEKMDENFLEDHYEINTDNCNIIGDWHGNIDCGNNVSFLQMMNWFQNANLVDEEAYQQACELIDIDNFIDYMAFETFIANWDWPGNNMRCWQEGTGRWRWMFFDGDAGLISNSFDAFANAAVYTPPPTWDNYPEAKLLFGKLLDNERFKTAFEERAITMCDELFLYENTSPLFQDIVETLRPNVENHIYRFGNPASMREWNAGNDIINGFLSKRAEKYLEDMLDFVSLYEQSESDVCVYPNPSSDEIHLCVNSQFQNVSEIAIYDALGSKVFEQPLDKTEETREIIIRPKLESGIYLLRMGGLAIKIIRY